MSEPTRSKMFPHEDHAVAWRFNNCERCGAMVAANNKNRHERWHRNSEAAATDD